MFNREQRELKSKLQNLGNQLADFTESFEALTEDLDLLAKGRRSVLCVDFYDLYRYLNVVSRAEELRQSASRNAIEDYIRVLLFHVSNFPIILMPWYVREFRAHSQRVFSSYWDAEVKVREWVEILKREIQKNREQSEALRDALNSAGEEGAGESSIDAIRKQAKILANRLRRFLSKVQNVYKEAAAIQRYDALVKQGRIIPLKEVVGSDVNFKKDRMFREALRYLEERRKGWTEPNEADAWAVTAVPQLSEGSRQKSSLFLLVSGSNWVAEAVRAVREILGKEKASQIRLRTPGYWRLWFSVASKAEASGGGSRLEYKKLRKDFTPQLRRMRQVYRDLAKVLEESSLKEVRKAEDLERDLGRLAKDLEDLLERLSRPILDARWRLTIVGDTYWSIANEGDEVAMLVERIERSVGALKGDKREFLEGFKELEEDLEEVETLIERISVRVHAASENAGTDVRSLAK